ncbi:MAG: transposase [Oscillospiraceae bacterium]|nr:transposase [Oscillospiraceae bacterium]
MDQLPKRKQNRLQNYDYSQPCVVLLTICAEKRGPVFGQVDAQASPPVTVLSPLGEIVRGAILEIHDHYQNVSLETWSVLPDHIHLLLRIEPAKADPPPTVSQIVRLLKYAVTKEWGRPVWQKGFHDHIVRNQEDFQNAWNYVTYNAAKWVAVGKPVLQRNH